MGLCNRKPHLPPNADAISLILSTDFYETTPLVSLDQAIQTLIPIIPQIKNYLLLVKPKCMNLTDGLTTDQSASIMLYAMVWQPIDQCLYKKLNEALLSSDPTTLEPWYLYLKLLLSAFIQLPSKDQVVYRGSTSDLHEEYRLDSIIQWKDLSLCTNSIDFLQSNSDSGITGLRTIYTIRAISVKDIHQHAYHQSNRLMLFLPGTKFQVIGSFHQTSNSHYIMLQEIESSPLVHFQGTTNTKSHLQQNKSSNLFTRLWPLRRTSENVPNGHHRNSSLEHRILQRVQSWTIDLDKQNITDQDMPTVVKYALVRSHCKRIRLRANQITGQGCLPLAEALENNDKLESLDLRQNQVGDVGIRYLAMPIALSNIRTLNLEANEITVESAEYLAEMLQRSQTLTELYLSKNDLGDHGVELLAKALIETNGSSSEQSDNTFTLNNRSSLQHLYLGENGITDQGALHLSKMLKRNQTLTWLWLTGNQISSDGVESLSQTLVESNMTLEWLFLNANPLIDDRCVDILLHMLKRNNSLKTLYINNCNLSPVAQQTLLEIIKTKNDFDLEV